MNIADQITKQVNDIAADAAARQALIGKGSRHAAEMLCAKISEGSGLFPKEGTVAGFENALTSTIAKSVDAMLAKGARVDDNTALMLGEALASYEFEKHEPKLLQVVREKNERIAEADRKSMPSPQSEIAMREQGAGVVNAPTASLPLMDAASALGEIERRGKQYPAKKSK